MHAQNGHDPPNSARSMTATEAPFAAGVVRGGLAGHAGADDDEVESVHGADDRRRGLAREPASWLQ